MDVSPVDSVGERRSDESVFFLFLWPFESEYGTGIKRMCVDTYALRKKNIDKPPLLLNSGLR